MLRLIVTLGAILIAGPALAADKVTLMLNWYVYGEHAPFYYGKEKGFYAANGIDLEIQEGRGSATVTNVVAAKTVEFGYVDVPTMMRAAVKGAPVVAVGVALQTNPMSAMGFADKNINVFSLPEIKCCSMEWMTVFSSIYPSTTCKVCGHVSRMIACVNSHTSAQ